MCARFNFITAPKNFYRGSGNFNFTEQLTLFGWESRFRIKHFKKNSFHIVDPININGGPPLCARISIINTVGYYPFCGTSS